MMTASDGAHGQPQTLRASRVFHARRQTVFDAWSSGEHVSRWFAPKPLTIPEATIEMRPGGRFDLCMRFPTGQDHRMSGRFIEIVKPERLVIDMRAAVAGGGPAFVAHTVIAFFDDPAGTRMDVTQSYASAETGAAMPMVAGAELGWASTLDNLADEVGRMERGVS